MDFQKTYTLIQQTPLIHFQHDQKGATLRATEVKPKLDRFIIKKMGGKDNVPADWFIGETNALNYKMRIVTTGEPKKSCTIDIELEEDFDKKKVLTNDASNLISDIYYGNMVSKGEKNYEEKVRESFKETVFYEGTDRIKLIITCFVSNLKETIASYIEDFFIVTNFGTMQNKGFGSFIIKDSDVSPESVAGYLMSAYGSKACYMFKSVQPCERNKYKDQRFKDIKLLYSVMKSGVNHGDYHRSYLFEYCHKVMGIGNEKAAMKKKQISPWLNGEPVKHPEKDTNFWDYGGHKFKYVRAMLGIGERIEYITDFVWNDRRGAYFPAKKKETITYNNESIERLASPICFKIIDDTVYIFAKRINEEIFNKEFSFVNESGKDISLSTPESFDIDKFLAWFVDEYNKSMWERNDKGNPVSYSIRKRITKIDCREVR